MFVVPFLETNPMAGNWLRKFLLLNVVIPSYWFAGLSKIRYAGLLHNFSGAWVKGPLQYKMDDSLVTGFSAWLLGQPGILGSTVPWTCVLFSWGNFLVEIVLPVAAMLSMTEGPVRSKIRLTFLILAVSFHVGIWILMSPNFIRSVLLLIFATNPASLFDAEDKAAEKQSLASTEGSERLQQSAALVGEYLRAIYGMAMWTGWNLVQLLSDYDHLAGNMEPKAHHDMYFPFSEFPMFAPSTKENWVLSWMIRREDETFVHSHGFAHDFFDRRSCHAGTTQVCLDGPVSLLQWSRPSTELDDDTFGAFVPVDGGTGRTCRAVEADEAANTDTDREIFSAANIGACKMLCQGTLGCVGINYHAPSTHCELWSSVELTSEASVNHTCLRFAQDADFLPVHGGSHRACGEDAEHAYLVEKSLSLSHCKMSCKENKTCVAWSV
eukprot:g19808.t1